MRSFPVKIVTPDGLQFDGQAEAVVVRTATGDMGIMAGHISCVAPLGMGRAMVQTNGRRKFAACIGGMVSVVNGAVSIVATTFEWAEKIDVDRALASEKRAKAILEDKNAQNMDIRMAEARLKRALIRQNVATHKPM